MNFFQKIILRSWIIILFVFSGNFLKTQTISVIPPIFDARTQVSYTLVGNDTISLFVASNIGSVVVTVYSNTPMSAGMYTDSLYLDSQPDGVYVVFLKVKNGTSPTQKIFKVKGTGLEQVSLASQTFLFPNPFTNNLFLFSETISNSECFLVDALGKILYTFIFTENSLELDLKELEKGVYFLGLSNNHGVTIHKVIKE